MISHVEQRSSRRESRGWFFFLARVVHCVNLCLSLCRKKQRAFSEKGATSASLVASAAIRSDARRALHASVADRRQLVCVHHKCAFFFNLCSCEFTILFSLSLSSSSSSLLPSCKKKKMFISLYVGALFADPVSDTLAKKLQLPFCEKFMIQIRVLLC